MNKKTTRAPTEVTTNADLVTKQLLTALSYLTNPVKGGKYSQTNIYQIRVNSKHPSQSVEDTLSSIEKILKSPAMRKLGVSSVVIHQISPNSSKFSSVGFSIGQYAYDVVLAKGSNRGQEFEKVLIQELKKLHAGKECAPIAKQALAALQIADKSLQLSNILSIEERKGNTVRSEVNTPEEAGQIIADAVITLKCGSKRYVSLKDSAGTTIANFGIKGVFAEDMTPILNSSRWKKWIDPLNVDVDRMVAGLRAYSTASKIGHPTIDQVNKLVRKNSAIYNLLSLLVGSNYIYLRRKGKNLFAKWVTDDYIRNEFLNGMRIVEVRYPSLERKQVTAIFANKSGERYRLELRNTKGGIVPNQLNFGTTS